MLCSDLNMNLKVTTCSLDCELLRDKASLVFNGDVEEEDIHHGRNCPCAEQSEVDEKHVRVEAVFVDQIRLEFLIETTLESTFSLF